MKERERESNTRRFLDTQEGARERENPFWLRLLARDCERKKLAEMATKEEDGNDGFLGELRAIAQLLQDIISQGFFLFFLSCRVLKLKSETKMKENKATPLETLVSSSVLFLLLLSCTVSATSHCSYVPQPLCIVLLLSYLCFVTDSCPSS